MLEGEAWLRFQSSVLEDLFQKAAVELEASGIRLLTGSGPFKFGKSDGVRSVGISPSRFSGPNTEELLSLYLSASTRGGPPRYVVSLEIEGALTGQAFRKLVAEYACVWTQAYLTIGLWVDGGSDWKLLNHLNQLSLGAANLRVTIGGTFLHSEMPRTIQQGLMLIGVLYRSVLDELSSAGKMGRLYAQLSNGLDGQRPTFQRLIRPYAGGAGRLLRPDGVRI